MLLYELLTGSTPLDRERLRKAAFAEMLRRITRGGAAEALDPALGLGRPAGLALGGAVQADGPGGRGEARADRDLAVIAECADWAAPWRRSRRPRRRPTPP